MGSKVARLTDAAIRRLDPGSKAEIQVTDGGFPGLAVRARRRTDGKITRAFVYTYQETVAGVRKTRKVFIGDASAWKIEDAREAARALRQKRDRGEIVVSPKRAAASERRMRDLIYEFEVEHLSSLRPNTARSYRVQIENRIQPVFGDRRVSELTRPTIRDWHRSMRDTPVAGNRALATLSKMLSFAAEREWIELNPALGIKRHPERPRDVWLDERDLPVFIGALENCHGPHFELIRFLLVTGWRVGEAIGLTWDMVDLPRLVANLPDTKVGAQRRTLSADAARILDRQEHRTGYVFSRNGGTNGVEYKHVRLKLQAVCDDAGIDRVSPHVLRHTWATMAATNGASLLELKDALGWKSPAMATRYVEKAEALGRQGAEKGAQAINLFGRGKADLARLK